MNRVRIAALAAELPAPILDDETLATTLGTDAANVRKLSRGFVRASADDGHGPATIAVASARRALETAGLTPGDVELIVFATTTPDITFPGSACLLQAMLEIDGQACIDVRSQCTGFLTALEVASRFVATGAYRTALIVAADVPTHVVRYDGVTPELAILTGDSAAAAVLQAGGARGEVLATATRLDGRRHRELWCEFPASRHLGRRAAARGERVTRAAFESGVMHPQADFAALRATALAEIPNVLAATLAATGAARVDALVLAHVDPSVEDDLVALVSPLCGRVIRRDVAYGFGSTLPLALAQAAERGELSAGETVALATSGSGASWGAGVLRW